MEATSQKIDLKDIDKSSWRTYRFDQIAKSVSERVDPNKTELEIYVGLEHLDPGSIHIRKTGSRDDVNGTKLRFYPGDVIFGRRRAYQRKAAVANFEGFCSAHSLVLRANPEVIDPMLFPFFLHSDLFMHRAIDISVGSLSPTINWGTLKTQEFLLPPKEQQSQLAELLWGMDEVEKSCFYTQASLVSLKSALNKKYFKNYIKSSYKIGEFTSKVGSGVTPKGGSKVYQSNGIRFIRSQNVLNGEMSFDDVAYISEEIDSKMSSTRVYTNDVLLNITGASIGRCAVYSDHLAANVNQHVCILRTTESLNPYFLMEFVNSNFGQQQIQALQAGGNREGLNFSNIRLMKFPEYDKSQQIEIMEKYNRLNASLTSIKNKLSNLKELRSSIINQIF